MTGTFELSILQTCLGQELQSRVVSTLFRFFLRAFGKFWKFSSRYQITCLVRVTRDKRWTSAFFVGCVQTCLKSSPVVKCVSKL
mmetsp:Transcript_420/g.753  ORF Transcript_420/g.753 Transcript_420/m.753 type:complete len:84 (+) Transcript_420:563-814(+)